MKAFNENIDEKGLLAVKERDENGIHNRVAKQSLEDYEKVLAFAISYISFYFYDINFSVYFHSYFEGKHFWQKRSYVIEIRKHDICRHGGSYDYVSNNRIEDVTNKSFHLYKKMDDVKQEEALDLKEKDVWHIHKKKVGQHIGGNLDNIDVYYNNY